MVAPARGIGPVPRSRRGTATIGRQWLCAVRRGFARVRRRSPCPRLATMTLDAPSNQITREKSEMLVLPREECLRLSADHRFGRMAVTTDSPVIRPVNFLFDEPSQSVVFRTADGSKFHALLLAGQAAFEIDGIDEGSRTGWSVIVAGKTEEVTGPSDVRRLDALRLEPWSPGPKPRWMRIRPSRSQAAGSCSPRTPRLRNSPNQPVGAARLAR